MEKFSFTRPPSSSESDQRNLSGRRTPGGRARLTTGAEMGRSARRRLRTRCQRKNLDGDAPFGKELFGRGHSREISHRRIYALRPHRPSGPAVRKRLHAICANVAANRVLVRTRCTMDISKRFARPAALWTLIVDCRPYPRSRRGWPTRRIGLSFKETSRGLGQEKESGGPQRSSPRPNTGQDDCFSWKAGSAKLGSPTRLAPPPKSPSISLRPLRQRSWRHGPRINWKSTADLESSGSATHWDLCGRQRRFL